MSFTFTPQDLPEVILVETEELGDHRGYFSEIYRETEFAKYGIGPFVQQNLSVSRPGVIRGLHYQIEPMAVGKLVTCLSGKIYDVAVDIRKESPTFGKWVGVGLHKPSMSLWIPPGFAHGFSVRSWESTEPATVMYRQTNYYSKDHDRSLFFDDPDLKIWWGGGYPIVSEKDWRAPRLKDL